MITILKNDKGQSIGWKLSPITEEEQEIVATIRDLQFFGFNETYPAYNGLELIDPYKGKTMGNIKSISWLQRKYQKQ